MFIPKTKTRFRYLYILHEYNLIFLLEKVELITLHYNV